MEPAFVTLHVGAGTFQPVRTEQVEAHRMHAERVCVPAATVERVRRTKESGGRVIAVGTTVVRSLETASVGGVLQPYDGESRLFIYPGFEFRTVDLLITNFHLPESSLLMMVSAFAGYGAVMAAYRHAIDRGYRFYSYGDAMLVSRNPTPDTPP
jgi:S-adenosylmethionine:tRNA ribosyltransferase-isomerase